MSYVELFKSPLKGWIDIQFRYDEELVDICRSLSTRRFDRKRKLWLIPETVYPELVRKLEAHMVECVDKRKQGTTSSLLIDIRNDGFLTNFPEISSRPEMNRLFFLKRPRDGYRLADFMRLDGLDVKVRDKVKGVNLDMGCNVELYPFQEECMQFLRKTNYSGLIALDMGLGKTIIACKALEEVGKGPALIVAPSSLLYQWCEELEEHFNKKATIITSKTPAKHRLEAMHEAIDDTGIIITNYEFLRTFKSDVQFEFLILDECQRVKNWETQTAQTISKIPARRVIGLSGTPVENNLKELYNITDQIKPAFFGTMKKFYHDFVYDKTGSNFKYKNLEDLYKKLTDLMFRKKKDEVLLQLPKLTQETVVVELTPKELSFYRDMLIGKPVLAAIANAKVFATSSTLRMHDLAISSKEKELFTLLKEMDGKRIVFSESKQEVKKLAELIDEELFVLHGDVPKIDRGKIANEFKASHDSILLMTEVGTFGLNMQHTNILINFDLPWTYARLEQRIGRIQRAKSKFDKCFAFNMMSKGTIDHHVINLITKKKELFDLSINGDKKAKKWIQEQFLSELSKMNIRINPQTNLLEEVGLYD
jgi:SNF2 family DNA or RNA helicase